MNRIELHGYAGCPFAWRTRLAAHEKGIPFDYIAIDVEGDDARKAHNPEKRSPLLVDGDVQVQDSFVITQYLDEAYPGAALQPKEPLARAEMRTVIAHIGSKLEVDTRPRAALTEQGLAKVKAGVALLEQRLGDGRVFLGGDSPALDDIQIWPFLTGLVRGHHFVLEGEYPKVKKYFDRMTQRPSYLDTRPPWARAEASAP